MTRISNDSQPVHLEEVRANATGHLTSEPLIARTDHGAPSIFRPETLVREARRQKGIRMGAVPPVCVLDPDGDVVRYVRRMKRA